MASAADGPAGTVSSREVLAFDLYGTLVDPIAIAAQLGQALGDSDGREAARLWRLKQLEYSFRLTAMGRYEDFRWVTSRALDFALASVGVRLAEEQARRLVELYDHLQPFPDAVPALRALAGLGHRGAATAPAAPASPTRRRLPATDPPPPRRRRPGPPGRVRDGRVGRGRDEACAAARTAPGGRG